MSAVQGATLLGRWEPESPEWFAARANRIGGSEIAAVLGLSPWDSRYSLWQRKAKRTTEKRLSESMRWGQIHEGTILGQFAGIHTELTPLVDSRGTWVNDVADWMLANPDGLAVTSAGEVVCVEAKTADAYDGWQWGTPGTDEIPPYYLCQVRWYLGTLNLETAYVVVLIGGNDYREYVIRQDPDDLKMMVAEGAAFMDSLDAGIPPHLDAHKATYEAVRAVNPDVDRDAQCEIDGELALAYIEAVTAELAAVEARRRYGAELLAAMGTAGKAVHGDLTLATRVAKKGSAPYLKTHPQILKGEVA